MDEEDKQKENGKPQCKTIATWGKKQAKKGPSGESIYIRISFEESYRRRKGWGAQT